MEYRVPIHTEHDATRAIMQARRSAAAAGFDEARVSMLGTVASELVRNILKYAGRGQIELSVVTRGSQRGLQAVAVDQGPGIESIELAMRDHFSSSQTLGLGLPGTKRLVDDFEIDSTPGHGTRVVVRKWV